MMWSVAPGAIEAFAEVVRLSSFSKAASALHITQPALSLRVKQLEEELGEKLLNRSRKGLSLTPAGKRLLAYIKQRQILDEEFLSDRAPRAGDSMSGVIRIAGHFSAVHHVAIPALADFLRSHHKVQIQAIVREDDEIPPLFEAGACDFALLQRPLTGDLFNPELLGKEKYILVRSSKYRSRPAVFLDSDPSDVITDEFIKLQERRRQRTDYTRSYLHNESGIIRAVALGLGQAVVAESELPHASGVSIVKGYRPLYLPMYLHSSRGIEKSRLYGAVREVLIRESKRMLHR